MINTYVEAPKQVQAIRLLTKEDYTAALDWMRDNGQECTSVVLEGSLLHQSYVMLHRDAGSRLHVNYGEWIVQDNVGVFWRVEPDLFAQLYAPTQDMEAV